jgi:hypothetical protein
MTLHHQLQLAETDLDIALTNARALARNNISTAILYLREAQCWEIPQISALLSELLADLEAPTPVVMTPANVVSISSARPQLVN